MAPLASLAPAIIALAEDAGRAILEVYAGGALAAASTIKEDGSPLTAADLASDRLIAAGLARLDPATPILSEEGADLVPATVRAGWRAFWCVDPLDGTKEFLSRSGEFTVNIALVVDGRPVLGVVHAPALAGGPSWWGGPALCGAWHRQGGIGAAPIRCVAPPPAPAPLAVVASKSHRDAATDAWITGLGRPIDLVAAGSSLKFCRIAEGSAHAYPRFGPTNAWDTAAGHAVVLGAGGQAWLADGRECLYSAERPLNDGFIAASGRI